MDNKESSSGRKLHEQSLKYNLNATTHTAHCLLSNNNFGFAAKMLK